MGKDNKAEIDRIQNLINNNLEMLADSALPKAEIEELRQELTEDLAKGDFKEITQKLLQAQERSLNPDLFLDSAPGRRSSATETITKPLPKHPESQELYGNSEIDVKFGEIQDQAFAKEVQEIAKSFPEEVQDSYEFKENLRRNVQNIIDLQEMHDESKENQDGLSKLPDLDAAQNDFKETLQLVKKTFDVMGKMPPQKYIYRLEDMNYTERQEAFTELNKLQPQKSQNQQKSQEEIFADKLDDDFQEALFDKIGELNEVEQKQNGQEKFSTSPEFYEQLIDSLIDLAQAPVTEQENLKGEILQSVDELIEYAQSQGVKKETQIEVKNSPVVPAQQPKTQKQQSVSDNSALEEQEVSAKRMAAIEGLEKGREEVKNVPTHELEFQQKAREFKEKFSKSDLAKLEAVKQKFQEQQSAKASSERRVSQNQDKGKGRF
jgi:hypothetical protein